MKLRLPAPLRLPILWFTASLLLGGSVFYLALDRRASSETRQTTAQHAAEQAERDLRRTPERLARDQDQAATHTELGDAGFIGAEDRLDWLSSLARLRAARDQPQLAWRLSPRAASNLSPGLYSSAMELEIVPADAQRLSQFLEQLRATAHGRFSVRECGLRPDVEGKQGVATCALDWWTWNGD